MSPIASHFRALLNQWFRRFSISCLLSIVIILAFIGSQAAKTRHKPKYGGSNNKIGPVRYFTLVIPFVALYWIQNNQLIVLTHVTIQCNQRHSREEASEKEETSHPNRFGFVIPSMSTCCEEIDQYVNKPPEKRKNTECPRSRPPCIDMERFGVGIAPLKEYLINIGNFTPPPQSEMTFKRRLSCCRRKLYQIAAKMGYHR